MDDFMANLKNKIYKEISDKMDKNIENELKNMNGSESTSTNYNSESLTKEDILKIANDLQGKQTIIEICVTTKLLQPIIILEKYLCLDVKSYNLLLKHLNKELLTNYCGIPVYIDDDRFLKYADEWIGKVYRKNLFKLK